MDFEHSQSAAWHHGRFQAMASPCEIILQCPDSRRAGRLLDQATQETRRIESKFSRYRDDNIIARINQANGQSINVDAETARLLNYAEQCWQLSEGLFDITSGVLRRVWRFDGSDNIPQPAAVAATLPLVGWGKIDWDGKHHLRMPPGMEIDLGGIGKEYAVDRVLEQLAADLDAPILVNFGGDLRCNRPRGEGQPWRVGTERPDGGIDAQALELEQGALATSGDARRFLLKEGQRYSHVLDPRSGWPVKDTPRSVTVAAPRCTEAGMLSTMALLQGAGAEDFLRQQGLPYRIMR